MKSAFSYTNLFNLETSEKKVNRKWHGEKWKWDRPARHMLWLAQTNRLCFQPTFTYNSVRRKNVAYFSFSFFCLMNASRERKRSKEGKCPPPIPLPISLLYPFTRKSHPSIRPWLCCQSGHSVVQCPSRHLSHPLPLQISHTHFCPSFHR